VEIFIFGEINLTMKEDKRKEKYVRKKNKIKSATKKRISLPIYNECKIHINKL